MKRTNPEKAWILIRWVEISWKKHLGTVADKLKAAMKKTPAVFSSPAVSVEESFRLFPLRRHSALLIIDEPGTLCPTF